MNSYYGYGYAYPIAGYPYGPYVGQITPRTPGAQGPLMKELIKAHMEWSGRQPSSWLALGDFMVGMVQELYGQGGLSREQAILRTRQLMMGETRPLDAPPIPSLRP